MASERTIKTQTENDNIGKGIALALAAFFSFAVMGAAAKFLSETHSIFELSFYRSLIAMLPILLLIVASSQSLELLKVKKPVLLALRVIIGNIGMVLTFGAVKFLPMADATLLFLSATLITPVLAFFFLAERMGWRRWGAVLFGFTGVALVLQPTGQTHLFGIVLALGAALTHSSIQVLLRALKDENYVPVIFYFTLGGIIMTAPFMPFTAKGFETANQAVIVLIIGLSGLWGQIFLTRALSCAPANSVSPFNFSGLLWATLFDILVWSYVPGWPVFIGAAMMISAKLFIIYRENINARNP